MNKKITAIFVLTMVIATVVPTISSGSICKIDILDSECSTIEQATIDGEVEISIYGTLYMMKNKPLGQMLGLYGTFENIGQNPIDAYFGLNIKTTSIPPWNQTIKAEESMTLPSGSVAQMPITAPLGIGFFTITYFMEGAGDDEGFYAEKTASGICLGFFQFVLSSN